MNHIPETKVLILKRGPGGLHIIEEDACWIQTRVAMILLINGYTRVIDKCDVVLVAEAWNLLNLISRGPFGDIQIYKSNCNESNMYVNI